MKDSTRRVANVLMANPYLSDKGVSILDAHGKHLELKLMTAR